MQLIIDIGNTMIKSYVFESDQIVVSDIDSIVNWHSFLEKILISYPQIQIAIVSHSKTRTN